MRLAAVDLQRARSTPWRRRPSFPGTLSADRCRPTRLSRQMSEPASGVCAKCSPPGKRAPGPRIPAGCAFPDQAGGLCRALRRARPAPRRAEARPAGLLEAGVRSAARRPKERVPRARPAAWSSGSFSRRGERGLCGLLHDARQHGRGSASPTAQHAVPGKARHGRAAAHKAHHHKVGRHHAVGAQRCELRPAPRKIICPRFKCVLARGCPARTSSSPLSTYKNSQKSWRSPSK